MRVRVEDKRKSRLLKFSDVVSVKPPGNNFGGLWTTWWDNHSWSDCTLYKLEPGELFL